MVRMDLRVRAWGWLTRRGVSVARLTDEQVVAMQRRQVPENPVTGWLFGTRQPGVSVTDRIIPGPDGGDGIRIRIYAPEPASELAPGAGPEDARPLIVYYHGGGFVFGTPRMGDWVCSSAALRVGAVVVSADYRLAPAHPFPAAVEDSYAALAWASGNAAELGAGGPIGVAGESAGGNLAAVVCLLARDRGGPAVSHQALMYAATDMRDSAAASEAVTANPNAPFLSEDELIAYRRLYLGPDGDPADPRASPLLAASHAGLPPALIQVAEHDPLRGHGRAYAAALRAAGVPV
ncbi:MAG: alpha/beta hydrolase, partial [Nocardiopsaceae bacterium]|nr:alpha/beta hydrolase [Nocardiopsaceae bacterium]